VSDFITDFTDLTRRVELGEIGSSNLVEMVLVEREKNAVLALALKESQVLYNEEHILKRGSSTPTMNAFEEMQELILWLALPWADNDPLFPEDDGWTPRALEANARMKATWQRVVRGNTESPGAVPEESKGGANDPE
jgi:hypothetical protein